MSKILLIGANHAGTAAANTILDNYPGNKLTVVDRNDNISYLGCGTALWVGRQIPDSSGLFYSSADVLRAKGATVHMETEVKSIDFEGKNAVVCGKDGKDFSIAYDKLILATGSLPIMPELPGSNLGNIQSVKLFQDGQRANELLDDPAIKTVAIVGAGYIGVELAEAVQRRGRKALLFEAENTSLASYYDPWLTEDMDKILADNGIELHFNERVQEFRDGNGTGKVSAIRTDKGEYEVDMVVMAIGFKPNSSIAADKLTTLKNGAIAVDLKQRTNREDVFAIGDCAAVFSNATRDWAYIALATNAVRSGIVAAHNACGTAIESLGVQGSNGISIYGYNMVSTGLSEKMAKKAGFAPLVTEFAALQKPAFMSNNHEVKLRIVYDAETRRVLGAQMASYENISMGIHMFSLAIEEGVTIDKLKLLDIFFLPHFNQPYNYITMAALSAK
ncbi:MAG: FAD-dependent oxidoreductase [Oscillospiraceae bacterium]|jgi:NADPH-dependent 2,4-dienoyl-CoA reductase/sulfur reductase-like enzyme|nr:FAD-dependent oxidoreductase [Oscillospiraceae bacterium]